MSPKLRVWWIPQLGIGGKFCVAVPSIGEAERLCEVLANYDIFQFENKIKPDYANAGGIEYFDDSENVWVEFDRDDFNDDEITELFYPH